MFLGIGAMIAAAPSDGVFGKDVGVRVVRNAGEIVTELVARSGSGKWLTILVSPTAPGVEATGQRLTNGLAMDAGGLFQSAPTFGFTKYSIRGNQLELVSEGPKATVTETYTVPAEGKVLSVDLQATLKDAAPRIKHFLASYAFAPGHPDATWTPGLRKEPDQVIADHFFRSPGVVVQKGSLSAILMPDLDVLSENRPIPTILDLDCHGTVTREPLLSYGFADYRLVSHVAFAHDASHTQFAPQKLSLGFQIRLDTESPAYSGYEALADLMWSRYGHHYFDRILPQAMPFEEYANVCYPAAIGEKATGGWFETTIDGQVCGGMPAGWGLEKGWVSWQDWFNQLRSAWGLHWWGKKVGNQDWVDKSNKMLNLALAAPIKEGASPTTYDSKNHAWVGCLIMPESTCYYDLTNLAWKGLSLLRWLQFEDCPRRDDVQGQVAGIAELLLRFQNLDGSVPTWLDKDLKVVPVLDRCAQSALPIWFLADYEASLRGAASPPEMDGRLRSAVNKGADFLLKNVVDQQRYYDFETFFSCSPKDCLQRDGLVDDDKMMDPYTLQRPQNTLCMQWTAEALRAASELGDKDKRMEGALKALNVMALYQNVWPISYRHVAYTYGGFGVQNSDGEYNDARQSQFAETLCDFGADLNRPDLFERGVAAARASLTLINHPLHEKLGIYPNPNYPLGLEPENDGHGGTDEQDGRTGFDWGEGSGLAGIAGILDRYGPEFRKADWMVLVDGVKKGSTPPGRDADKTVLVDPTFDFSNPDLPGWAFDGTFMRQPFASARMEFGIDGKPFIGTAEDGRGGYDDSYTGVILSPRFSVTKARMKLLVGGGSGPGEFVELIDEDGKQLFVEHGRDQEKMDERTWDLSGLKGKVLRIRIVDNDKGPWGHINVGEIRLSD
jgi:hypothetical protein